MDSRSLARAFERGPRYVAKKALIKVLSVPTWYRKRQFARLCAAEGNALGTMGGDVLQPLRRVGQPAFSPCAELASGSIVLADRFMAGEMLLFGQSRRFRANGAEERYPWQRDFVHGADYEPVLYTEVVRPGDDEIKVPWEFGRLHILEHLALAWLSTGGAEYGEEMRRVLASFEAENPVGYGVQWMCAMEVGIRAFNVLNAYALMAPSLDSHDDLHHVAARWALGHGMYLFANLETDARLHENNHYVADLLGLAAIGVLAPELAPSPSWRRYARKEAERVVRKQILEDGTGFEGSARYARLIWEMFALIGLLFERNDFPMSEVYWHRLGAMADALSWMTPKSGLSPQIGDNDSGRALYISEASYADLRYPRQAMGDSEGEVPIADALFFANVPRRDLDVSSTSGLKVFSQGRLAIYRNEEVFLCLSATDAHRFDVPGHTHGDKLSLVLEYRGCPFFVDPGTGNYTCDPGLRDRLRSVRSHSTIQVEHDEQNEFDGVFWSGYNGSSVLGATVEGDSVVIEGSHDCYRERYGITHRRRAVYEVRARKLRIEDHLEGWQDGEHGAILRFVLHPDVHILSLAGDRVVLQNGSAMLVLHCPSRASIEKGYFSPEYSAVCETSIVSCPVERAYLTTTIDMVG
jgi:Uncharacterized protein conserved in bacteria